MWWVALYACGGSALQTPLPLPAPAEPTSDAQPVLVLPALPTLPERPSDCTLDLAALTPKLVDPQQGRAPVRVSREGRLVETFVYPNGVPVRLIQEGCAHIGVREQYGLAAEPADLYAKALELSSALETVAGHESHAVRLKAAGALGADGSFPCGDAHCEVRLYDGDNTVLEISYDFAL